MEKGHLHTIESEGVQGTEGTIVMDRQKLVASDTISQNPY